MVPPTVTTFVNPIGVCLKIRYFEHLAHFQTHRHYIPNLFPHEMVAIPRHIAFQDGYPLDVEARAAAPAMTPEMNLGGSSQANCTSWGK